MGEADWWLCGNCQSLNNLSARKCYSCRKRKPKGAIRASEYLGYDAVESWDGKITMQTRLPPDRAAEQAAVREPTVPPIRDPISRDTLAVAPRPPAGVRISYRDPPIPAPPPFMPGMPPPVAPLPAPLASGRLPPGLARVPIAHAPVPRPAVAAVPPPRPVDAGALVAQHMAEQRSHWHELLDVPTPDADRIRAAYRAGGRVVHHPDWLSHRVDGSTPSHASNGPGSGTGEPQPVAVVWPAADLATSSPAEGHSPRSGERVKSDSGSEVVT